MRTRILPPEEWTKLEGTPIPDMLFLVAPENVVMVVAEDDEGVIGVLPVLQVTHFEGLWVKPERRRGVVLRGLLRLARAVARTQHQDWVLGSVNFGDGRMGDLITRPMVGGKPLASTFYKLPVGRSKWDS